MIFIVHLIVKFMTPFEIEMINFYGLGIMAPSSKKISAGIVINKWKYKILFNVYKGLIKLASVIVYPTSMKWDFINLTKCKFRSSKKNSESNYEQNCSIKPADWDDEPATIPDPNASKPNDWDDEEDGEWQAPQIDNPEYKGMIFMIS